MTRRIVYISVLFILTTSFVARNAHSGQQAEKQTEWLVNFTYGFPFWIALNYTVGAPRVFRREIYIYFEPSYFTPGNLKKLFTGLAAEYPSPDWFTVTAFSDRAMIQRAININTSGIS